VLADGDFAAGRTATDFLDTHPELVVARLDDAVRRRHAAAASLFLEHVRAAASVVPEADPSWRNVGRAGHADRFTDGDDRLTVVVGRDRRDQSVTVEGPDGPDRPDGPDGPGEATAGARVPVRAIVRADATSGTVDLEVGGIVIRHRVRGHGHQLAVSSAEGQSLLRLAEEAGSDEAGASAAECRAPLPGSVLAVLVAAGDRVEDGTGLVVLEAMKMEHTLRALGPGLVQEVPAVAGQQVDVGDLLVLMTPAP
jgi:acetyl/propionyl-CoA carboxylase alpha subunit